MLKTITRNTNTGNSVANYTEEIHQCDQCRGNGFIHIEKEDLVSLMDGMNFRDAIHLYRQWLINNRTTTCPDCEGTGDFVIRY